MQSNLTRLLPLLLVLWLPGAALAQPETVEAETAGTDAPPAVVGDKDETDEQSPPLAAEAAETERSPHDYRPSEDISEDLSVSFPVDI
mgnify:CR=1 FL=1